MATAGGTARPARFGPPPPGWCCWGTGWPATKSRCDRPRDLPPGELSGLPQEAGLVGLDHQQVGGVLVGGQPVGVLALGVQRVGGDHHAVQVQAAQQWLEGGDLVAVGSTPRWARTAPLAWAIAASRWTGGREWAPLPRRVLPSTVPACRQGPAAAGGLAAGGCWLANQAPTAWSSASGSMRASTRRTVASPGGLRVRVRGWRQTPSAASTPAGASAAHSPIAASDLAPASTAATATASTVTNASRRPRRQRGSAIWVRASSRLRHWSGASTAGAAGCWAAAEIGHDELAGTVVRSGRGL
jgi:hypothetical protein